MRIEGRFCERQLAPRRSFAKASFRWTKRSRNWLLIGCPKGKWRARAKHCSVGTKAYKLLVASASGRCSAGRRVVK
jgi:hypothetical protein